MTQMDSIKNIADLERKEFLPVMKKIIIMHILQDKEWTNEEKIVKEYIKVLNQL